MNKIPEEYRKYFYFGLVAVVAVWVFCIAFVISIKAQQSKTTTQPSEDISAATVASSESTGESLSEVLSEATISSAADNTETVSIDGNNIDNGGIDENSAQNDEAVSNSEPVDGSTEGGLSTSEASEPAKIGIPSTKEEIVKTYVDAVNKLKDTSDFKLTKSNKLNVTIDSVSGGDYVKNIVQKYIDEANVEPQDFSFVNGNDSTSGSSPNVEIAPASKIATLSASDVKNASVTEASNGGFIITIELGKDRQTLNEKPPVYSSCMDVLDMDSLGLTSSMKVNSLDIDYSNGKIVASIDSQGRIIAMNHSMKIQKATGSGKITLISVSLEMHGTNEQTYEIIY